MFKWGIVELFRCFVFNEFITVDNQIEWVTKISFIHSHTDWIEWQNNNNNNNNNDDDDDWLQFVCVCVCVFMKLFLALFFSNFSTTTTHTLCI